MLINFNLQHLQGRLDNLYIIKQLVLKLTGPLNDYEK